MALVSQSRPSQKMMVHTLTGWFNTETSDILIFSARRGSRACGYHIFDCTGITVIEPYGVECLIEACQQLASRACTAMFVTGGNEQVLAAIKAAAEAEAILIFDKMEDASNAVEVLVSQHNS